jgi:hypothetical protein
MEIEKTFIVEKGSMSDAKRFVKVYLSNGRYFLQVSQGAISEISKEEFDKLNNTKAQGKEKLKELESMYQISRDWNYNGIYTEAEYMELIGEYADYNPSEIVDEMCKIIREL